MKSIKSLPILFLCATLFPLVGCQNKSAKYENKKIVDWYHDNYSPLGPTTFELKEFDNPKFNIDVSKNLTQENGAFKAKGVYAVYVYDINKDGYRELCISATDENNTDYSYIYDLKNNEYLYYIKDCDVQNVCRHYHFYLDNIALAISKDKNDSTGAVSSTYSKGLILYSKERGVYTSWINKYAIRDCKYSLTTLDPNDTPVNVKREKYLTTGDLDDHSLYCLKAEIDDTFTQDYSSMFSLTYRSLGKDNIKVVDKGYENGTYKMVFYFNGQNGKAETSDYEVQISGYNENYRFNIASEGTSQTVGDLLGASNKIKAVNDASKVVVEENQYYEYGRFYGLRFIDEITRDERKEYAVYYLDSLAYEVNDVFYNTNIESSVRLNYYDKSGTKYSVEINNGRYFMKDGKCYASFENFDMKSVIPASFLRNTKIGFFKEMKNVEIEDLDNSTKVSFNNLDLIEATWYSSSSEHPYPPKGTHFKYRINTDIKNRGFYIVDANTFISDYDGVEVYVIESGYNFANLFQ